MYANKIGYTDITPFEVIRFVSNGKAVIRGMEAQQENAQELQFAVGGFSARCVNQNEQVWTITSNEAAPTITIRLHKDAAWRDVNGNRYQLSEKPVKFYDFNF